MLTVEQIAHADPRATEYELKDSAGLVLRVLPSGTRTWTVVYQDQGRRTKKAIGRWPEMGIKAARAERDRVRGLAVGVHAVTLRAFAAEYIDNWARPYKRSWRLDQRILEGRILPMLGRRPVVQISRSECAALLDEILQQGKRDMAARVHAVLRRVLEYAVERGLREYNPALRMKLRQSPSRDRVLGTQELATWWPLFAERASVKPRIAAELVILTCQRLAEVLSMEERDLDRIDALWTIPARKAKNGITHTVPLTSRTLELIDEARRRWPWSPHIVPVSAASVRGWMADTIREAGLDRATPHDLRRTGATWLGRLGYSRTIQDRILNHVDQSVSGIYDRYEYEAEKREALEAWGEKFASIVRIHRDNTKTESGTQDTSDATADTAISTDERDAKGKQP